MSFLIKDRQVACNVTLAIPNQRQIMLLYFNGYNIHLNSHSVSITDLPSLGLVLLLNVVLACEANVIP